MLLVIMLSVVMLGVALFYCYTERHYAECLNVVCRIILSSY
jgi:hypothetical protein